MRISVVTAAWMSAETLADTMESVLAQNVPDRIGECGETLEVEHIVVDGGSDDGTEVLLRGMDERYRMAAGKTLKWVSEKDNGIYDAMNKGIGMATGDVVGLLNSDDFYTSDDVLARVAAEFAAGNEAHEVPDAIYGDVHYVNPSDLRKTVRYYSSRPFRRWKMRFGYMPAHPSFYCRREVYERFGLFDCSFRVAADFENLLRIIYINRISTRYVPMDFVTMRTGGASSSGLTSHRNIFRDHLKAYRKNHVKSTAAHEAVRYVCKGTAEVVHSVMRRMGSRH